MKLYFEQKVSKDSSSLCLEQLDKVVGGMKSRKQSKSAHEEDHHVDNEEIADWIYKHTGAKMHSSLAILSIDNGTGMDEERRRVLIHLKMAMEKESDPTQVQRFSSRLRELEFEEEANGRIQRTVQNPEQFYIQMQERFPEQVKKCEFVTLEERIVREHADQGDRLAVAARDLMNYANKVAPYRSTGICAFVSAIYCAKKVAGGERFHDVDDCSKELSDYAQYLEIERSERFLAFCIAALPSPVIAK